MIDWKEFYAVLATFQTYNGGTMSEQWVINEKLKTFKFELGVEDINVGKKSYPRGIVSRSVGVKKDVV